MKIAVMQPYFLPYLGYFRLMHEVDKFIIFDNAQMSKRSWIIRNRFSGTKDNIYNSNFNDKPITISLPISKSSQTSLIAEQNHAADSFFINKTIRRLHSWYPNRSESFWKLVHDLFFALYDSKELVGILERQLKILSKYLGIRMPEVIRSSDVLARPNQNNPYNENSAQKYIINVCQLLEATTYLNLPSGRSIYEKKEFEDNNIALKFIEFSKPIDSTPLLSALHYASFEGSVGLDLIHQYWSISYG